MATLRAESKAAATRHAVRANELLALIARRIERVADDFYDIGSALKELKEKKLFAPLGFATFDAMLAKRVPIGRTQAYKLMAIVEHVTRAQAVGLGEEKAYAIARLVAATPEADSIDSVLAKGVRVGSKEARPRSMSRREIDAVRKSVVAKTKHPDAAERDAKRAARTAQASLRRAGISGKIEVTKSAGVWWATVRLPVSELPKLHGER